MKLIKYLREAMEAIERAGDEARAAKAFDDTSIEDLASAHANIDRVLVRLRFRGMIDPEEIRELERSREESFRRMLGFGSANTQTSESFRSRNPLL